MIFQSPFPDVEIPDVPVHRFVLERAGELGDKPALVDGGTGRVLTYGQLDELVRRTAAGLAARGFTHGDVFAAHLPNLPEYAVAFHAVASLGGALAPVSPLATTGEIVTQLTAARARYLLTLPQLMGRAAEAAGRSGVEEVFVLGEAAGATPLVALLAHDGPSPDVDIDPRQDLAVLPTSSGTSGLPKPVMLTHRNLVANLCQIPVAHCPTERDTLIGLVPFVHILGMQVVMNLGLRAGATIVTMARPDFPELLRLVQDHGVTRADVVPPLVHALARHPLVDQFDVSSLEVVMSAAAPLAGDVQQACSERLGCLVKQAFGLTETSPATHGNPDDRAVNRPGSIGVLVPRTEARLVDPATGTDVGSGQDGELWIRGPQVMKGYLGDPAATADTIDAAGWLRTGDLCRADEDGYFWVVDRLKELIKYKGAQVAPAELEALLMTHPAVADVAVTRSADAEAGEVPKAFVVLREPVAPQELMTFVAEHVAPHKRIRRVEMVDEIPRAATGKILRRLLVEREQSGRSEKSPDATFAGQTSRTGARGLPGSVANSQAFTGEAGL